MKKLFKLLIVTFMLLSLVACGEKVNKLNGDYYGWWMVDECTGKYEEFDLNWWDICATIKIEDGVGHFDLWDEDYSRDDLLGKVIIKATSDSTAKSVDGSFSGAEVKEGDWIIDFNDKSNELENYLFLEGTFKSEEGSYRYTIHLRPWGIKWDELDEDQLPYYYNEWYLPLIEAGKSMPDLINDGKKSNVIPPLDVDGETNTDTTTDDTQTDTQTKTE